jgi:hypothetical protein
LEEALDRHATQDRMEIDQSKSIMLVDFKFQSQPLVRAKKIVHANIQKITSFCIMPSISSTLFEQMFVQIFCQSQNVTRKSCQKRL